MLKYSTTLIILMFSSFAVSANFEEQRNKASQFILDGDYEKFVQISTTLANQGDVESQSLLAQYYSKIGHNRQAEKWYLEAVKSNSAEVKTRLAGFYLNVYPDTKEQEAMRLLTEASNQGYKRAEELLNVISGNGPTPPDLVGDSFETKALVSYLREFLEKQMESNPAAVQCFKLELHEFQEKKGSIYEGCEESILEYYSGQYIHLDKSKDLSASFSHCVRNGFQSIRRVTDQELIDCNKRISTVP